MAASVSWRLVESFESFEPDGMERAGEAPGVRRFRADGSRAVLLAADVAGAAGAEVLVVDPPDVDAALALLDQLGTPAGAVLIALPADAARRTARQAVGLVPEPGPVSLPGPDGAVAEYALLRPTDRTPTERRLASGPRPGEDPDGLDARGRWFDARHRRR